MTNCVTREVIENILGGTKPKDLGLYVQAFTHKSCLKEDPTLESYERLEFIGDSVLGFVITRWLYDNYSNQMEGFLTKARTKLVRGEMLASVGQKLGLQHLVRMDKKGMSMGWHNNTKLLEDVTESLIGAVYLDLGLLHAKQFILRLFSDPQYVDLSTIHYDDNWKDHLMRYTQQHQISLPDYRVVGHDNMIFTVDAYVDGHFLGRGEAKTKKQAEQNAARAFFYPQRNT
jgi:ribonuclease-3